MMLHYHTRFGNKMFFGSEDIIQTFTDILNLCCGLELECSNPIFPHNTPAYNVILSNQVWLQTDQQFRRYSKNSQIWIIKALAVTLTLKTVNQFLRMTHRLMIIHHHTKFCIKKKWLSGSGDNEWIRLDTQTDLQMYRRTDRWTDGPSDFNIPPCIYMGGYN